MRVAAVPRSHPAEPRKNPPVPHGVPVVRHFPNGSLIGRARSPLGPTCGYWPFWSGSYRGQWVVRGIRAVRRHEGRRGRPLDVLVEWEGETGRSVGGVAGQRHGAHGGPTGRGEATEDGPLRSAPWIDREPSSRQARGDGPAASLDNSSTLGLIGLSSYIGPRTRTAHAPWDRPLPPRSACLGFPPRHVCAAERCLLLTLQGL